MTAIALSASASPFLPDGYDWASDGCSGVVAPSGRDRWVATCRQQAPVGTGSSPSDAVADVLRKIR